MHPRDAQRTHLKPDGGTEPAHWVKKAPVGGQTLYPYRSN